MSAAKRAKPVRAIDSTALMSQGNPPLHTGLRERLTEYLALPAVARQRGGETTRWIGGAQRENKGQSAAASLQATVDQCLSRVLAGEDPRTVFKLNHGKRGEKVNLAREQAAVCEVARLVSAGLSRPDAIGVVAIEFGEKATKTVERWCAKWDETSVDVEEYVTRLKDAKLI